MSHYQIPTIDQAKLDAYYALFRGDESVPQPETASWEYLIALTNMLKWDEITFNVSATVIDTVTPAQLDYFFHGDFNSGNFAITSPEPVIPVGELAELVGMPAWEAM